jgi:hypothetical protein
MWSTSVASIRAVRCFKQVICSSRDYYRSIVNAGILSPFRLINNFKKFPLSLAISE